MNTLLIKRNGTLRLEQHLCDGKAPQSLIEVTNFDSMSQLVNYCNEHDVDVHIKDIRYE